MWPREAKNIENGGKCGRWTSPLHKTTQYPFDRADNQILIRHRQVVFMSVFEEVGHNEGDVAHDERRLLLNPRLVLYNNALTGYCKPFNDTELEVLLKEVHFLMNCLVSHRIRIPANEVASKRTFSSAGNFVTPFRETITSDHVFLHVGVFTSNPKLMYQ